MKSAQGQSPWIAERGLLPRGTTYEMRKPNQWNGTLINDLDFAQTPDAPRYLWLLNHGYAVSGTARRAGRNTNYDPAHEIVDLINADLLRREIRQAHADDRYIGSGRRRSRHGGNAPGSPDGARGVRPHEPWLMSRN